MSRVEIYSIGHDGEVRSFAEVRNATAGALTIWMEMAAKHKVECEMFEFGPLWKQTRSFSRPDQIVLAATYDRVWIRRERCSEVAAALRAFWAERGLGAKGIVPTIPGIADELDRAAVSDIRGVCFNQTSVCSDPWVVRHPTDPEERIPFNFDRDTEAMDGGQPWELFDELDRLPE